MMISTPLSTYLVVITTFGLLCAGCMPIGADAMRAEADRMDANATQQAAEATAQRQAADYAEIESTRQAAQATSARATEFPRELTATVERATAQAVEHAAQLAALQQTEDVRRIAAAIELMPTRTAQALRATATQQAHNAERRETITTAGLWGLIVVCATLAAGILSWVVRRLCADIEQWIDDRQIAADMERVAQQNSVSVAGLPVEQWQANQETNQP